MLYRIEDEFDTTPERYWEMFFSKDYNEGLWPRLDVGRKQISFAVEGEGADRIIRREQVLMPRRELPSFMKKLAQGALTYRETNVFTARNNRMEVITTPSLLPHKITSTGVYRLEKLAENRIRRIYEGECVCRIPLVGRRIEKQIVNEVEESYRKTTDFTRHWLARN